jgi:hypothetical protein
VVIYLFKGDDVLKYHPRLSSLNPPPEMTANKLAKMKQKQNRWQTKQQMIFNVHVYVAFAFKLRLYFLI